MDAELDRTVGNSNCLDYRSAHLWPKELPDLGSSFGRSITRFKEVLKESTRWSKRPQSWSVDPASFRSTREAVYMRGRTVVATYSALG